MAADNMLNNKEIEYIIANADSNVADLLLQKSKTATDINISLCAKCIEARKKIMSKIPLWYNVPSLVYPFSISVEQCSSQATALFKQRIVGELNLGNKTNTADLTGGMGVDTFFIAQNSDRHYYFERNAELSQATEYNFKELGVQNVTFSSADITDNNNAALKELNEKNIDLVYIDPARRDQTNSKVIKLSDYQPNIFELKEDLFAACKYILVKVSPMADIKLNLKELSNIEKVYTVAVNNECKELLFLINTKQECNNPECVAVNLTNSGEIKHHFKFFLPDEDSAVALNAKTIGSYLYEPNKAVLKCGAYKLISKRYNIDKLAVSSHLYTSDELVADFPGKTFVVEKWVPFNKKALKEIAKEYPQADLSARNFPLDTNGLKKLSGIKDGGSNHIFATTIGKEKVIVVCR